jgi:orotate phosphoribosyltransferase-like protein
MSRMSELAWQIDEMHNQGMSAREIAMELDVSVFFVNQAVEVLDEEEPDEEDYPWQR